MPTYHSPLPGDTVFVLKKKKKTAFYFFIQQFWKLCIAHFIYNIGYVQNSAG